MLLLLFPPPSLCHQVKSNLVYHLFKVFVFFQERMKRTNTKNAQEKKEESDEGAHLIIFLLLLLALRDFLLLSLLLSHQQEDEIQTER